MKALRNLVISMKPCVCFSHTAGDIALANDEVTL